MSIKYKIEKRIFDILFSVIFLIVCSPIILICTIIQLFFVKNPFFVQRRVGINGKEFKMIKFRSMKKNDTENTSWSKKDDSRITTFGKFLRSTSIDEIPQFINVIKGDMSIVGPRPEIPYYVNIFSNQYPDYNERLKALPGITGYAQIKGLRGDTSIRKRIDADLYYIKKQSFMFDIKICLLTALPFLR